MATVHVAIYDAVMAISGTHQPYAAVPAMPGAGASVDAAVSSAAYNMLAALFPNRSAQYQAAYDAEIAKVLAGAPRRAASRWARTSPTASSRCGRTTAAR